MTLREISDFEIVFGGDKPKYGRVDEEKEPAEELQEAVDAEELLGAAITENVSLFGLCFRGKPVG